MYQEQLWGWGHGVVNRLDPLPQKAGWYSGKSYIPVYSLKKYILLTKRK